MSRAVSPESHAPAHFDHAEQDRKKSADENKEQKNSKTHEEIKLDLASGRR